MKWLKSAFQKGLKNGRKSGKSQGILKRILSGNPERPRKTWIPDVFAFIIQCSPAQWRVSPIIELFMPLLVMLEDLGYYWF